MDRRSFLFATGGLAAATLTPGGALAGVPTEAPGGEADRKVLRFLERTRRRRDRVEGRILRRMGAEEGDPAVEDYARYTASMTAIERLARLSVEEQVHPEVQALTRQLLADVGRGAVTFGGLFDDLVESGVELEPDHLEAAFQRALQGMEEEPDLSEAARRVQRGTMDELYGHVQQDGLISVVRRESRRLQRLKSVTERVVLAGGQTAAFAPSDPRVFEQVAVGNHRWSGLGESAREGRPPYTNLEILGIFACGLAAVASGAVVLFSIFCAIACESPGFFAVALLGGVVLALCVLGIQGITRRARSRGMRRSLPPSEPSEVPSLPGLDDLDEDH